MYNRAVVEVYRELIIPIGLDNGDSVCTEVENTNDTQFIMRLAKTDNDTRYALGNTIGAVIFNCTFRVIATRIVATIAGYIMPAIQG